MAGWLIDSQEFSQVVRSSRVEAITTERREFVLRKTGGSGQVFWTCTGRKTLPPSTSLPVMREIAGANTASLGVYLHSMKTRARWAEGFHDEHNGHVFDLERDGLHQVVLCP